LPKAETLLTLQSFVLALAAVPIYKLAKENAGVELSAWCLRLDICYIL
jgi:uncharacterized membrane protein